MATPVVVPPTTEQKVLDSIGELSQIAAAIATRFGHSTVGGAIAEYSTLAPVFAGIFDSVRGLFAHHKATQPTP